MKRIVGYEDYMAIPPGETRTFEFETVNAMNSCESIGRQMPKAHPRPDVERYRILHGKGTKIELIVTALPKEGDK